MLAPRFTPFPVLHTERLVLRQLTDTDAAPIFQLRTDDRVNRYLDRLASRTIEDAKKFIQKINESISRDEALYWAICLKEDEVLIGTACFWNISKTEYKSEIGYELMPDWQGRGIMNEAMHAIIKYGFETLGLKRIDAIAHPGNKPSITLLEKLLFKRNQKAEAEASEGQNDTLVYTRLK